MARLSTDGGEKFIKKTIALAPKDNQYNPSRKPPSPGTIMTYRSFIEVVSKYVKTPINLDAIDSPDPQRGAKYYRIEFSGCRVRPTLRPNRIWELPLNRALRIGVQPEQVRQFRELFELHRVNDSEFYQISFWLP